MPDHYHFHHARVSKRSLHPSPVKHQTLALEPQVSPLPFTSTFFLPSCIFPHPRNAVSVYCTMQDLNDAHKPLKQVCKPTLIPCVVLLKSILYIYIIIYIYVHIPDGNYKFCLPSNAQVMHWMVSLLVLQVYHMHDACVNFVLKCCEKYMYSADL